MTHASGGPLNDIVVPFNGEPTGKLDAISSVLAFAYATLGYHATTPEAFAQALHEVLTLTKDEEIAMRTRARTWAVKRFSEEEFEKGWEQSGWKSCL